MVNRIILIYLFLVFSLIGFAQPEQSSTPIPSENTLAFGIQLIENDKIQAAEKFIRKFIDNQNTPNEKIKSCYSISITYNNKLYYNLSLEYALEGLRYSDLSTTLQSELNHVIIINHIDLKNYDLAEAQYWKASSIQGKSNKVIANEYNLIGEIHRLKGEYEKSLSFYHKAIKINLINSFKRSLAIDYNNIALSHLYLGQIDSTNYYLDLSTKIIDQLQLDHLKSAINISYGELYLMKGDYTKALVFFKKTMDYELGNHPDKFEVYQDAYNGMKNCYELLGDYENALKSYVEFQKYKTKILDYNQNASVLQSQIISERIVHNKEIELINSKLELEIKYKRITLLVLATIILIIILIINIWRIQNKRGKDKVELEVKKNKIQELEIEKIKLNQEQLKSELIQNKQSQEIKKLERIRLEEQIQFKNRELTSTAIHLMSKNELLNQIQDKISQLSNQGEEERLKASNEIKFLISDSLRLDEDWKVFKNHFTDVHPNFFGNIKAEYPSITTEELKLCAYLKIQLSSKEIARLINVTVAAVNKRRNRLRKKLNILPEEDFQSFFLKN